MFRSIRSYLSRFSGLILFVLAAIVVAFLLVLTINSAGNKGSDVVQTENTSSNFTYDEPQKSSETSVSVKSDSDSSKTSYTTSNPQTLGSTEVNLDSSDSVSINVEDNDNGGVVAAPGAAITNTGGLPNTGPMSIVGGVAAFVIAITGLYYWFKSRHNLNKQLLGNR